MFPKFGRSQETFIWQCFDLSPNFPRLQTFLNYWETHIEGRLYSVSIAQAGAARIADAHFAKGEFILQ